jgi:hypothetical protein
VEVLRPRWATWTFLVYAGGFVAALALSSWLSYFAAKSGDAGYAAWALLVFAIVAALTLALRRSAHPVAAGVFAFLTVIAFVAFVGALWRWFGWAAGFGSSALHGFHVGRLLLELIWFVAALVTLRSYRFPLLVAQVALAGWLFVADLISNGGNWSAVVSMAIGLVYLAIALGLDGGASRPYGFWMHVAAGLAIGGGLLWFWHDGNVEWTLVVIFAVLYVLFAGAVGRSSWAVLGAFGLVLASTHFTLEWTHRQFFFFGDDSQAPAREWVPPLVASCTALLLLALGLRAARRAAST